MRKIILFLLLVTFNCLSYAQDTVVYYYNSEWVKADKANAAYVRKAFLYKDLWCVRDIYLPSENLEKTGYYKSISEDVKCGLFVYYYQNGNKKYEGRYHSNFKVGKWQSWYEAGNLRSNESYVSDTNTINKILIDGIIGAGYNFEVGKYFLDSLGIYSGVSEWFFQNNQMSAREEWGKVLLSIKHWNENGKKISVDKNKPIAEVVNSPPLPKYGFEKAMVNKDFKSKGSNLKGRSIISFFVDIDGSVVDEKIEQSSGAVELDEEALAMVRHMNGEWMPGRSHNLPYKCKLYLPIKFK